MHVRSGEAIYIPGVLARSSHSFAHALPKSQEHQARPNKFLYATHTHTHTTAAMKYTISEPVNNQDCSCCSVRLFRLIARRD